VARAFDLAGAINTAGAPSFAHFAKGGNLERMRHGVAGNGERTNVVSAARTRPCKKRKDRAPSA
jgi:hypothetical protein